MGLLEQKVSKGVRGTRGVRATPSEVGGLYPKRCSLADPRTDLILSLTLNIALMCGEQGSNPPGGMPHLTVAGLQLCPMALPSPNVPRATLQGCVRRPYGSSA